ncbi:type I secretion system permease/ATPase [Allomesorhizobium alhagi]|uniref:Putative Type I secretion system ATPase, PrtD n=1 Tax=Mesorhizobium alhagi CCNWXJ12-2 TaxID=1107882 RepID=H0HYN4_9HYPH|nr:putative Type I secretion system ATPase, PrtD [Mesorhizobium alhagi CCNWXJ12-2]
MDRSVDKIDDVIAELHKAISDDSPPRAQKRVEEGERGVIEKAAPPLAEAAVQKTPSSTNANPAAVDISGPHGSGGQKPPAVQPTPRQGSDENLHKAQAIPTLAAEHRSQDRTVTPSPSAKTETTPSGAHAAGFGLRQNPAATPVQPAAATAPRPASDAAGGQARTPAPGQPKAAASPSPQPVAPEQIRAKSESLPPPQLKAEKSPEGMITIDGDRGPVKAKDHLPHDGGSSGGGKGRSGGGGGGGGGAFHKRLGPVDFAASLKAGKRAVKQNLIAVMVFTVATNLLVLAIPIYLFQISDRVLTSRSTDTLVMLTIVVVGAVVLQATFDAIRRFILMRTAVEVAAQLGSPILSAAARASLHGNGREYQTLGDLQQLRSFLVSGTLLAFLDAPMAPLFILAVFLVHPHLGFIVVASALVLLVLTLLNQRATSSPFGEANAAQSKANLHLDSMSRNSQIINALAMIPEAVRIWGKDTASSLTAQVVAQDRNIAFASVSRATRLLTQVMMLGWGAYLAIEGSITGGMVIAASIIAGRALGPIEGAIEGWNQFVQSRAAYGRITALLQASPLNFERLNLPRPQGRLDIERLLFVPQGTKRVVLNGISFSLSPGDSLAIIGNSGAGKTTLGKMLVGSILPTSGNVRLDLMDLRNWDPRQFGENIGYLPQDVQLFPGTIKANIARMREDVTDAEIYEAAQLADVHEMIATLPHGYETIVAADGSPLSGGQKQRVALARAFFGNPRMVVLDEPNSNLDSAGDTALARALQHAKANKITVITITQRPSILQNVDKILLLVNGTVALFGKRTDVVQALQSRGISIEGGSFGHQIE